MPTRVVPWVIVLMACLAVTATAQSPSASPGSTALPSPTASVPPALPPRPPKPDWDPTGPADATVRRDGISMGLWLSDTVAVPGTWVQAHVRITNTSKRTRFHEAPGRCVGQPFEWDVDMTPLFDPGRDWPGAAGRFKRELTDRGPVPDWVRPDEMDGNATVSLAECTGPFDPAVGRLAAGTSIVDDYAIYPEYMLGRPLPPGPFTIHVSFNDWGDAAKPDRGHAPLSMAASVLVSGPDPGYPSPLVLIDRALSVPDFYRYVVATDGHHAWTNAEWLAWPSVPTAHLPRLAGRAPDGYLGIGLFGDDPSYMEVALDPWTGEILAFGSQ